MKMEIRRALELIANDAGRSAEERQAAIAALAGDVDAEAALAEDLPRSDDARALVYDGQEM